MLDGLLYHESDLRIEEHYTDTAGRDLADTELFIPKSDFAYDALKPMIGGTLNIKHVRAHWEEILWRSSASVGAGKFKLLLPLPPA